MPIGHGTKRRWFIVRTRTLETRNDVSGLSSELWRAESFKDRGPTKRAGGNTRGVLATPAFRWGLQSAWLTRPANESARVSLIPSGRDADRSLRDAKAYTGAVGQFEI